jgi:CRP/FNR family cyclic AMP-dependent transcriptional regulator
VQAADYLKQIPLFSDLAPDEIVDVLRIARVVTFAPGKLLCTRGEQGDCAYVIEQGEAAVRAVDEHGKLVVIARVGAGEILGELALVDGHPRSADVVAVTEVRGYRIDRVEFDALRRAMHPAAFKMLRRIAITVSDRLRDVNDAIAAELKRAEPGARASRTPSRASQAHARRSSPDAGGRTSDPGRASRAGVRASREISRASLPGAPPPVARPSNVSRAPEPRPERARSTEPAAPPGGVWRSMLARLTGASWK